MLGIGPHSSIVLLWTCRRRRFVVQHLDMSTRCGFVVELSYSFQLVVDLLWILS